jgi:hypothetical protein
MENSSLPTSHLGGKWFKFDDDIVTPADRREAVEMCYGSGGSHGKVGDYSSAYMLVYIREKEAPQVSHHIRHTSLRRGRLFDSL